jgi:hypothetical protein
MALKVRMKEQSKDFRVIVFKGQLKNTEEHFSTLLSMNEWMLEHGVTMNECMVTVEKWQRLELM